MGEMSDASNVVQSYAPTSKFRNVVRLPDSGGRGSCRRRFSLGLHVGVAEPTAPLCRQSLTTLTVLTTITNNPRDVDYYVLLLANFSRGVRSHERRSVRLATVLPALQFSSVGSRLCSGTKFQDGVYRRTDRS